MNVMDHQPDLWMSGIFTVQDAADLVGVRARLARTWVAGQKGRQAPVIESQLGLVDGQIAISFTNLMELRFISAFHKAGFRLPYIRRILDEAKSFLQHPHPTTTEVFFRTDGAKIFGTVERKKTVDVLYDLESKNYAMFPIIRESLKKDMEFDPQGDVIRWFPRKGIAPHIIVDPTFSFGRPVLKDSHIPTETLVDAVNAEGSTDVVANLYDVPLAQVREAVRFHENLLRVN